MSTSGPFSSVLSRFWAIWGRFGGDLGSFLARSAPRVLSGAHFGAIWGDFGALRCCGRRSFLLCFLRPPLPWQRDDITGTFWGGTPHFFTIPPPPPLASHPPALQSCKEPPVQGVPSCTPELLARGWRALSHEVSLHKQQQLAQGVPLGVILREFGGDLGRPGHHLGAISALFGGNSGSL